MSGSLPTTIATPSSFLRPPNTSSSSTPAQERSTSPKFKDPLDADQHRALKAIRSFLKVRTSYDVLPVSFRLIILDTTLLVKKSLNILVQNGIVSAPLWDSNRSRFAGLLTATDYINVIQYYYQYPEAMAQIDQFRLNSLREVEKAIGVSPPETISIHPMKPLYDACRLMIKSRARRVPLIDVDDETQQEMVLSVVTQYRILRFVALNVKETQMLRKPLKGLNIGSYKNLTTATMDTPVMDVIHKLVKSDIASVPIVDASGVLLNCYEAVDILTLIRNGSYDDLQLTVGEALLRRPDDFPGIHTCTANDRLESIFDTIRNARVHRLCIIDEERKLKGMVTLGDILQYLLLEGIDED